MKWEAKEKNKVEKEKEKVMLIEDEEVFRENRFEFSRTGAWLGAAPLVICAQHVATSLKVLPQLNILSL